MPLFGLAGATGQAVPVVGHKAQSARGRMHQHEAVEAEVEANPQAEVSY